MYAGKLVFAQVMEYAPWHTCRRLVAKYHGDFNVRSFSCLDQFLCMVFARLTYRESLRDIEACLGAQPAKLYRLGIRGNVSRSALASVTGLPKNGDLNSARIAKRCGCTVLSPRSGAMRSGIDLEAAPCGQLPW